MNKRRKLLAALGAGALTVRSFSFAQSQGKVWRIGFLWERAQSTSVQQLDAFKAGLRELGYTEGKDYSLEHRSANNDYSRLAGLAAELVALKVDLIVSSGTPSTAAARKATREIPNLIVTVGDPVGSGFAATLARPGGNITGLTGLNSELDAKRLDLLRQILPDMRRVGILYDSNSPAEAGFISRVESTCEKLQMKPIRAPVSKREEIAAALGQLKRDKAQALLVSGSSSITGWHASIIEQAAKHRLPAMYARSALADSGQLISYASNVLDLYRRAAAYADKIFKGAKPGDLPIEQPTKFEMMINLKTAQALGIKIPGSVLVQATKVIE